MTFFYSDMEPHSQYSPGNLHLSPATRILSENPAKIRTFLNPELFFNASDMDKKSSSRL